MRVGKGLPEAQDITDCMIFRDERVLRGKLKEDYIPP
jgi:hypothetical protein